MIWDLGRLWLPVSSTSGGTVVASDLAVQHIKTPECYFIHVELGGLSASSFSLSPSLSSATALTALYFPPIACRRSRPPTRSRSHVLIAL